MKAILARLRADLGILASVSLAILAASAWFAGAIVKPLEMRRASLERELERNIRPGIEEGVVDSGDTAGERIEEFYRFFERNKRPDEWLAKVYGIATAAGLELRAGTYSLEPSRQRLERYRIHLPVSGSYVQVRTFLEAVLAEVPILSLDQATFRRKAGNEKRVDAEIVLTLHLLRK